MIIYHDKMYAEATEAAACVRERLDIPSRIVYANILRMTTRTPNNGIFSFYQEVLEREYRYIRKAATLVLLREDIYHHDTQFDPSHTWMRGFYDKPNMFVVSSARHKGRTDTPQRRRTIPLNLYRLRMNATVLHEIGHKIVKGRHLKEAVYVDEEARIAQSLGMHCPDPECVLYETISMQTPKNPGRYLQLGGGKRFDAVFDEWLSRLNPNIFCDACQGSMKIGDEFFTIG